MASNNPQVEVVIRNACRQVGEGPLWDVDTQTLYFVDPAAGQIHRWNPATQQHQIKDVGGEVTFIVPRRQGGFVIGLGNRMCTYDWDTNTATTIAQAEAGTRARFNDGKCDASGRVWAGTLTPGADGPPNVQGAGSVYRLDPDRSLHKLQPGMTTSNGMAWAADNTIFYFNDSAPRNIYAFDYNMATGVIRSERTAVYLPNNTGGPDGMTIDTDDNLWVCIFNNGVVLKVDPRTGQTLQRVSIPTKQTASAAWGGRNLDELYVTTAALYSAEDRQNEPLAGSLFKVTGLGVRGLPANAYNDQA